MNSFFSSALGEPSADLRQHADIGVQVIERLGIEPRRYTLGETGRILSAPDITNNSRFVIATYHTGISRVFVCLNDPALGEWIYRPFHPTCDPACWQIVECWMVENFSHNQQNCYQQAVLCAQQMQPVRVQSLLFGVLTAPLPIRVQAFLRAAKAVRDDD